MPFSLGPRALSAGYRLAAFDQIGSTNAEAMSRAREGERGPIWFVTSEQTAGRGRRHRPWIAPRGNLASSVLEVVDVAPSVAATLGFAAGLALEAALQRVSIEASLRSAGSDDMKFSLKWPNDVLAGRQQARRHPAGSRGGGRRSARRGGRNRYQRDRGTRGHANARDLARGARRTDRRRGSVHGAVGLLGGIPRNLGRGPRI